MVASVPALMAEKFGNTGVQDAPVESNKVGEPMDIAHAASILHQTSQSLLMELNFVWTMQCL